MANGLRDVQLNFIDQQNPRPSIDNVSGINGPSVRAQAFNGPQNMKKKRSRRKPRHKNNHDNIDNGLENDLQSTTPLKNHNEPSHSSVSKSSYPESATISKINTNFKQKSNPTSKKEQTTFVIKQITNHSDGKLIRKRNVENKFIKLKSFTSINSNNCLFITNLSILFGSTINFDELKDYREAKKVKSKAESRKFPVKDPKKNRRKREKSVRELDETPFPNYLTKEEIEQGLANGELIKGFVRINPRKNSDSYVSNEDTSKADYYLTSVSDRNKALDGDEVVLQIKPESEWVDGNNTAKVVYISQKIHPRIVVGTLKPVKNSEFALLHPRDTRCPLLRISKTSWPNGFFNDPKSFEEILFVAKILEWTVPAYAQGILIENLGLSGDLKVETLSILREFCLDTTPFGEEVNEYLPESSDIPEIECERREDIRRDCVFTIDPATARDLDDAVSVKTLTNGNYEIGVHISDVSYYLDEGTELDQKVSKKATSIYMVDTVYHMLPVELCLHCSLLPGVDKLSFSVFWEMTKEGEIINKRYTRSIMNSCTKLAYEHAQTIIENPGKIFTVDDFPEIHNGFKPEDLVDTVNILHSIASILRDKRIKNGALKIDQVKLSFSLDPYSGLPQEYWKYENKESHRMIEEFMLLANISVAENIYESFPDKAFLRCHEPPKQTMLVELQNNLATYGIHLDISSSGTIAGSLKKYITSDYTGVCRQAVLNHLTAKAMTRARYFSSSSVESDSDFKHYALSVPIYTHFTSPIRRYADVMVHRLLAASLKYREPPEWDEDYVSAIAANCNAQKYNAKRAGEASVELYLSKFIENHKPYEQDCVVVDVKERAFDVIVLKTGSIVRIYQNSCEQGTLWKIENVNTNEPVPQNDGIRPIAPGKKQLRLAIIFPQTKYFPKSKMIVEIFSLVKVNLQKKEKSYKLEGTLLRPVPAQIYNAKVGHQSQYSWVSDKKKLLKEYSKISTM